MSNAELIDNADRVATKTHFCHKGPVLASSPSSG
jgi:hypothetical protein